MFAPPICRRRWRNNAFPFRQLRRRRRQPSEHRSERSEPSNTARCASSSQKKRPRPARQQTGDVERAGCGKQDCHDAQDDGQDQVKQEDSEGCKEAELEGCPCSNPDLFRLRDVLGGHVPTLPSGRSEPQAALPGPVRSFALVWWETYVLRAPELLVCVRIVGNVRVPCLRCWARDVPGAESDLRSDQTLRILTHCTE
jgi:hypothetical protein